VERQLLEAWATVPWRQPRHPGAILSNNRASNPRSLTRASTRNGLPDRKQDLHP
jgi:hypothetical protein